MSRSKRTRTRGARSGRKVLDGAIPVQRSYRIGLPGALYISTTLFLFVGAINSQNNMLFWAFGLALGGVLISGFVSGSALMGVRIERIGIDAVPVGEAMAVRYRVSNRSWLMPAFALHIEEASRTGRRSPRATWPGLMPRPRAFVAHVGPGQRVHAEALVWPARRGLATLDRIVVSSVFPFGLMRKLVVFSQPASVLVHPPRLTLRPETTERLHARDESGAQLARHAGYGQEYFGLREYISGDSQRDIAWRASARTGELVVRQTSMPTPTRLWIQLHIEPHENEEHAEMAIALAGALARDGDAHDMAVGLVDPARGIMILPAAGRGQLRRLLDALGAIDLAADLDADGRASMPGRRGGRHEAFVVIHAGVIDPTVGPPGARHATARDADELIVPGADALRTGGTP